MSTQEILMIVIAVSKILLLLNLWLTAEADLNKLRIEYYKKPRIRPFPAKRGRIRKFFLRLLTFPTPE